MASKSQDLFLTIRSEGAILPPDLLQRIVADDHELDGLKADDYHLPKGEKINEATSRAWNRLLGVWASFRAAVEKLADTDPGTSVTRERWLQPFFQELGYGRLLTTKAIEIDGKSYAISHGWNRTPIHLVGCHVDLDRSSQGVVGASRSSPHSLLQEVLNRSASHLWGFVTNGLQMRVLRNNASLTRQAFVEFDLEAMMLGENYADFVLLWLLCHQSRVEAENPHDCWLEKWSQAWKERGVRALDHLRRGVELAIVALGRGFLRYPSNRQLRDDLRAGTLDPQDYYRQLLRLVYRLLFMFSAEDRGLLLLAGDEHANARTRFLTYYSTARLRRLAERRTGTRHTDLFAALRLVMTKLSADPGCPDLALPALGSFLFSFRALPNLEASDIANLDLCEAIRALSITVSNGIRRPVDYKNLGAEELGSVYESLLELHPRLNLDAASFELSVASGHERKTTGSYYTPTSLIDCLLDSALDPVLAEAARNQEPEKAILALKVVDPACGSGHFLIAAAQRLAKGLATARTGDEEPSPEFTRRALRDVIGHCIYGVDINPMAAELCRVSLWLEALEPGKPLSFLDHHIRVGNAFLGTTPALLSKGIPDEVFDAIGGDDKEVCKRFKKLNKEERLGIRRIFSRSSEPWDNLGNLAASIVQLDSSPDDSIDAIRKKERMYEALVSSGSYLDGRFWADAWCAAFVWKKTEDFNYPITEDVFRRIQHNPHACDVWMREEIERLARQYQFFHWHLAFPDVFHIPPTTGATENEQTGWDGGFDVILGNPPWEMPETDDRVFFSLYRPDIASEQTAQKRQRLIASLAETEPTLWRLWREHLRSNASARMFFAKSGVFPHSGSGRLNYYRLFIELNWNLLKPSGSLGMIVQSGLSTNKYEEPTWRYLVENSSISSLLDFENGGSLFPGIDRRTKFTLLSAVKGRSGPMRVGCWLRSVPELSNPDRTAFVTIEDLKEFDPDSLSLPQFRSRRDLTFLKAAYSRFRRFATVPDWSHTPKLMFSSSDADFQVASNYETLAWPTDNLGRRADPDARTYVPVYEGKMVGIYDHRQADIVINPANPSRQAQEVAVDTLEKVNPSRFAIPQYWLRESVVRRKQLNPTQRDWTLAFCDVTSATNERTCVAGILPLCGLTRSMPAIYIKSESAKDALVLQSILSSLPLDYYARLKVAANHLTQGILESLPIPPQRSIHEFANLIGLPQFIDRHALELTYTSWDLQPFAADFGYAGPPFRWDDDRRFLLQCELDAFYFHVYGIAREDAEYIMDTFPITRRKEERQFGEHRSKRVILEIYEAMAEAQRTGTIYRTRVDPAPADPRVAHPAIAQPVAIPLPHATIAQLSQFPPGAWATPSHLAPEHLALFALIDVILAFNGAAKPGDVRAAAILVRNPAMALAFLGQPQAKQWVRVIGPQARPLPANVVSIAQFQKNATDLPWSNAMSQLTGSGALQTGADRWIAADNFPVSSGQDWVAGRAAIAVELVSTVLAEEIEDRLTAFLGSVADGTASRAVS